MQRRHRTQSECDKDMARLRGGKPPQVDWRKFLLPPGCVTLLAPIGPPGGEGVVYEALVTLPQPAARIPRPSGATPFATKATTDPTGGGNPRDAAPTRAPTASASTTPQDGALLGPRSSVAPVAVAGPLPGGGFPSPHPVAPLPRACDPRLDIGEYLNERGAVRASMVEEFALMCSTVQDPRQRWILLQILRESQARSRWGIPIISKTAKCSQFLGRFYVRSLCSPAGDMQAWMMAMMSFDS